MKQALLASGIFDDVAKGDRSRGLEPLVPELQRQLFRHILPAYLLDGNFQYLDWNPAFDEIIARPLGLRRGMHGTALITRLANCDEVMERSMKVFAEGKHPLLDHEPILLKTERHGLIRFEKLASQMLDSRGRKLAWALTLNIVSADRIELLWEDIRGRIERESVWHQYAIGRDGLLVREPSVARALDRLVEVARGSARCLEVGSGAGELTRRLLGSAGPELLWAQEDNAGLLDAFGEARPPVGGRLTLVNDAAERLQEYPSEFFDVVVSWDGLRRASALEAVLAESRRALRPGGKLGLVLRTGAPSVPAPTDHDELARHALERAIPRLDELDPRRPADHVGAAIEAAGFEIVEWDAKILGGTFALAIAVKREER